MKKAIFSLLILVAIGASAFTSAESKVKRASYYYVLLGDGSYHLVSGVPSEVGCLNTLATPKCVIGFDIDPNVESFPSDEIPEGQTYTSLRNGIWTDPIPQ